MEMKIEKIAQNQACPINKQQSECAGLDTMQEANDLNERRANYGAIFLLTAKHISLFIS